MAKITLTGVPDVLPLTGFATVDPPGDPVLSNASVQVHVQQLLNMIATLGAHLDGSAYTDVVKMNGRTVRRRARVQYPDGGGTIKVTDGDVFELVPAPAAPTVITLSMTSPVPAEGETMRFVCPGLTNVNSYQFQRTGPVVIASLYGTALGNTCPTVEFEFTGGVWRMGMNSGWNQTETQGVLAGAGA